MEKKDRFPLFPELYGSYVQMDDRFETVHIWSHELAVKNKGRWTPVVITKSKYEAVRRAAEKIIT